MPMSVKYKLPVKSVTWTYDANDDGNKTKIHLLKGDCWQGSD